MPMVSLGINYSQSHDSSACVVRGGELLCAIAEERLSRVKHDARFPVQAIRTCLDLARLRLGDLDYVSFGWSPARTAFFHDLGCYARAKCPASYMNVLTYT